MPVTRADELDARPVDNAKELLACPFCGGLTLATGGDDKFVGVRCIGCEAVGPNHYITGRDWNTRLSARQQASARNLANAILDAPAGSATAMARALLAKYDIFEKVEG